MGSVVQIFTQKLTDRHLDSPTSRKPGLRQFPETLIWTYAMRVASAQETHRIHCLGLIRSRHVGQDRCSSCVTQYYWLNICVLKHRSLCFLPLNDDASVISLHLCRMDFDSSLFWLRPEKPSHCGGLLKLCRVMKALVVARPMLHLGTTRSRKSK